MPNAVVEAIVTCGSLKYDSINKIEVNQKSCPAIASIVFTFALLFMPLMIKLISYTQTGASNAMNRNFVSIELCLWRIVH